MNRINKEISPDVKIVEISSKSDIPGRLKIRAALHSIHPGHDVWQANGISWDERYVKNNLDTVANMSICVEFTDSSRELPSGHGLTGVEENFPRFEKATVVGHFTRGYITEIETDGAARKVLVADGYIDSMRYPKFVAWLKDKLRESRVMGSVEIIGKAENDNLIIYDGGYKDAGRVPKAYCYSGYAILGVDPADDAAIVMELNHKKSEREEEDKLGDEVKRELKDLFQGAFTEQNSRWDEYYAKVAQKEAEIEQLKADIAQKNAEIAQLNADYQAKEAEVAAVKEKLSEANAKVTELEKARKIDEMNAALAGFSEDEKSFAKDLTDAFAADPGSVEVNAIVSKIYEGMGRESVRRRGAEQNSVNLDIYGTVNETTPNDSDDSKIYG